MAYGNHPSAMTNGDRLNAGYNHFVRDTIGRALVFDVKHIIREIIGAHISSPLGIVLLKNSNSASFMTSPSPLGQNLDLESTVTPISCKT